MHFLVYLAHYFVARFLYDGVYRSGLTLPVVVLLAVALVLWSVLGRRRRWWRR
jgi:uncharacterized protein (TIGR03382 family)